MTTAGEWFKGPEIDTTGDLYKAMVNAMYAVHPAIRRGARWVMDLDWYRRIRAIAVTEEQETARAYSHATLMVPALPALPVRCPACTAGPFATMGDLADHAAAMADPANREPADGDCLLGIPLEVAADGGVPHLENRFYPANVELS